MLKIMVWNNFLPYALLVYRQNKSMVRIRAWFDSKLGHHLFIGGLVYRKVQRTVTAQRRVQLPYSPPCLIRITASMPSFQVGGDGAAPSQGSMQVQFNGKIFRCQRKVGSSILLICSIEKITKKLKTLWTNRKLYIIINI